MVKSARNGRRLMRDYLGTITWFFLPHSGFVQQCPQEYETRQSAQRFDRLYWLQAESIVKYPDDINFLYFLENHGWSTCLIFVEGKVYEMGPTHIFDNPIEVLLNSMIELLKGADETEFKWQDEPGEYKWSIKRIQEQKHRILVSTLSAPKLIPLRNQNWKHCVLR